MKTLHLIIEIRGGTLQAVYANPSLKGQIKIDLLDRDDMDYSEGEKDEFHRLEKDIETMTPVWE